MRVQCYECGKNAVVRGSTYLSEDFKELYCECRHCQTRWKANLCFEQSINPPAGERLEVLHNLVCGLSQSKKQLLLNLE